MGHSKIKFNNLIGNQFYSLIADNIVGYLQYKIDSQSDTEYES